MKRSDSDKLLLFSKVESEIAYFHLVGEKHFAKKKYVQIHNSLLIKEYWQKVPR